MLSDSAADVLAMLDQAAALALEAREPEAAIEPLTACFHGRLGDPEAGRRAGNLPGGAEQFFVAGTFMITPDGLYHLLVASQGFPAEQRRLMIPIEGGHPGWVVRNRRNLLLRNTDKDREFRQYLKTARMGSAMYVPMFWHGRMFGQLVMAALARNTFGEEDLRVLSLTARIAAAVWIAAGGPQWLESAYPPANAYRVGTDGLAHSA
jgi:GAF domain